MKKYLFIIFSVFYLNFGYTQNNFTDTKGELSITNGGTTNYKVPIALPPGIKNVGPQIALVYDSGYNNGIAGYGWNLIGVSSISKTSTRIDIDGYIDGVDFDSNDQYALDGQRLLKQGVENSLTRFKTENFSNLKIECKYKSLPIIGPVNPRTSGIIDGSVIDGDFDIIELVQEPEYFIVTSSDGSQSFYGSTTNSRSSTEWLIDKWVDPQGNTINYTYETLNGVMYLQRITYGKNEKLNSGTETSIYFYYTNRSRTEVANLQSRKMLTNRILNEIVVFTNSAPFRQYKLTHEVNELQYQFVKKIQEFNGSYEPSNPIEFTYDKSENGFDLFSRYDSNTPNPLNNVKVNGDFDGDGEIDFIANNKLYQNSMSGNSWSSIDLPFLDKDLLNYPVSVLNNGKFNQKNSFVKIEKTLNNITYKVYSKNGELINLAFEKVLNLNTTLDPSIYTPDGDRFRPPGYIGCSFMGYDILNNKFKEKNLSIVGDFNGDGISEIFIRHFNKEYHTIEHIECSDSGGNGHPYTNEVDKYVDYKYYLTNLKDDTSNLFSIKNDSKIPEINDYFTNNGKAIYVLDFNGDGKDDILIPTNNIGGYTIIGFKEINGITEAETIWKGTLPYGKFTDKQIVWGDFNGDGKADVMIPEAEGSYNWTMCLSKGNSFESVNYDNFIEYKPYWQGAPSVVRIKIKQYRSADLNKDGKSDFIVNEYESYRHGINNRNGRGHVYFMPNLGADNLGKIRFGIEEKASVDSEYGYHENDQHPMHLLIGEFKKGNSSHNLAFIQGNQIWKLNYKKNQQQDARLIKVSEANNNIISTVEYGSLKKGEISSFYYSENQELYPYIEINSLPNTSTVKSVKVIADNKLKQRDFKYQGLTSHAHGLGIVGFKKTYQSSWYIPNETQPIWIETITSPQLKGAVIEKYSYGLNSNYGISKIKFNYLNNTLPSKERILVLNNKQETDYLTGVSTVTNYTYDSFYNISKENITIGQNTKNITKEYYYLNNASGLGHDYYIGRLNRSYLLENYDNNQDSRFSETNYIYQGNLIKSISEKKNNSFELTKNYIYDGFGNIIETETSTPGLVSRKTKNEYDQSGRFVIKKTDIDGLSTYLSYNNLGQIIKNSNPSFGTIEDIVYDKWGKVVSTKITGTSTTPLVTNTSYLRLPNGGWVVTNECDQSKAYSQETFDVFGNSILLSTKGFNSIINKSIEYDILGKKIRESEPYLSSNSPSQWNNIFYDNLNRPINYTFFNGKETNIEYLGLQVNTTENGKTKSIINNALNQPIKVIDNGQNIIYKYYATGEIKSITYGTHVVEFEIDGWGRKISMKDPSISSIPFTYSYNNFSEILSETTPTSTTNFIYGPTGKLITKTATGVNTNLLINYEYNNVGLITKTFGNSNGISEEHIYGYDSMKRLSSKIENYNNSKYKISKDYEYDSIGRIDKEKTTTTTSSGLLSTVYVKNNYNLYNGILDNITDANTGNLIWKITDSNHRMQITSGEFGNGIIVNNSYNNNGDFTNIRHTKSGMVDPLSLDYNFDEVKQLLNSRKNNFYNWTENFTYDNFERLVTWSSPNGTESNNYHADGRISESSNVGSYSYDSNSIYKKEDLQLNTSGNDYFNQRALQEVTYDAFKKPIHITEENRGSLFFKNGIFGGRSEMFEKGIVTSDINETNLRSKFYSSDGTVEIVLKGDDSNATASYAKIITYIGGDGYTAPAMYVTEYENASSNTSSYYYLHRDYQGSIMAISNHNGNIIERRHYDPWGNVVKFTNESGVTLDNPNLKGGELFIDRGYTGHEHLFRVGLIHMNGRLYDPILKGFLSPDNYVQDDQNSQNFNRYAYCYNNPLKFTDPSGEVIIAGSAALGAVVVGAIIGGVVYTGVSLYTGSFSWTGLIENTVIGAISGAFSSGVGTLVNTAFPVVASSGGTALEQIGVAMLQAGAHGFTQGVISGVSGGNFASSFVSGALSSVASSAYMKGMTSINIGGTAKDIGTVLFGSVTGGVSSQLTGGNFWQGAAVGLTVSALNHVAHKFQTPKKRIIVLKSTKEATSHYFNGNGESRGLDKETRLALRNSPEYQRVIRRLKSGEANKINGSFDVDMTGKYFHIGDTNVDYSTTCKDGNCITIFKEFVNDGYYDPDLIDEFFLQDFDNYKPDGLGPNLELGGGKPYMYIPSQSFISYPNPGY